MKNQPIKKAYLQIVTRRKQETLTFEVDILETKQSYGRTRYLVRPALGSGKVWVEKIIFKPIRKLTKKS